MEWPGDGTLIATCGGGGESALEREIDALGMELVSRANGMVRFRGSEPQMIAANLRLRSASRVLVPIVSGSVASYDELYRLTRGPAWHRIIPANLTIAVSAVTRDQTIADSRLAALKVKDGIVDSQRYAGRRSSIDRRHPDAPISVHVSDGTATISLDGSGAALHERGYRREAGEAPLRETVAAAMLLICGWDASRPLLDPFCGSGTIAIEAALIAARIAPGLIREHYAFERWPWVSRQRISDERETLRRQRRTPDAAIVARDNDPAVLEIARRNAGRAGVADWIRFEIADALSTRAPAGSGVIVTNPPYGERMELEEARSFYRAFGDQLKNEYGGWDAWILSANREAMKGLGLRTSSKTQLWNGGLDARLVEVRVFGRTEP